MESEGRLLLLEQRIKLPELELGGSFVKWDHGVREILDSEGLLGHILFDKKLFDVTTQPMFESSGQKRKRPIEHDQWAKDDERVWFLIRDSLEKEYQPSFSERATAYDLYAWLRNAWHPDPHVHYETCLNDLLDLRLGDGQHNVTVYVDDFDRLQKHLAHAAKLLGRFSDRSDRTRFCVGHGFLEALFIRGTERHHTLEQWRTTVARRNGGILSLYPLMESLGEYSHFLERYSIDI